MIAEEYETVISYYQNFWVYGLLVTFILVLSDIFESNEIITNIATHAIAEIANIVYLLHMPCD